MVVPAIPAKKLAAELARVCADRDGMSSADGRAVVVAALDAGAPLATQAADAIAKQQPSGFEDALQRSYAALSGARAATLDPGCLAKVAIVAALDVLEDGDAGLFASAAAYTQVEKLKGGLRDTAAGVRARGVLGVARLGHPDAMLLFGACLGDRDATVRLSAARAIGHRQQRDGAGLLLLRLAAGDDTPDVRMECVRSLFAVASDFGTRYVRDTIRAADAELREQLLHVLGTANEDGAVALLAEELEAQALAQDRRPVIAALSLSRRPRARELLLDLLDSERAGDAEAALAALAVHRYDERLVAEVRARTAGSRELSRTFAELFLP